MPSGHPGSNNNHFSRAPSFPQISNQKKETSVKNTSQRPLCPAMTSFVREILSATGTLGDKDDWSGRASKLQKRTDDLKAQLSEQLSKELQEFEGSFLQTQQLLQQLTTAKEEVGLLRQHIEAHVRPELAHSQKEMRALESRMGELSATVRIANRMKRAYEDMSAATDHLDRQSYLQAALSLRSVDDNVNSDDLDDAEADADQAKAFRSVRSEFVEVMSQLQHVLAGHWDEQLAVDVEDEGRRTTLKLGVSAAEGEGIAGEELFQAMFLSDMLAYRLSQFGLQLVQDVLGRIVKHNVSMKLEEGGVVTLEEEDEARPQPGQVFESLGKVFERLHEVFNVRLGVRESEEEDEDERPTVMQLIGESFGAQFVETLIQECLAPAVPNRHCDLGEYAGVIEMAERLQRQLVGARFLDGGNTSLADYAGDIENTFADKRTADILGRAREMMKGDLHETEEVESGAELQLGGGGSIRDLEAELNLPDNAVANNGQLFRFPKCQVSRHVAQVLALARETLEEACEAANQEPPDAEPANQLLAAWLVRAARQIFELYRCALPVFHRDALEQFPQHSALAFTNCMKLSHDCVTMGVAYQERLPGHVVSFADLVPKVRAVGMAAFQRQMRAQRDQLAAIISDSGLAHLSGEAKLPPQAEKSLKQVLHQLSRLRSVWQHVLPLNVYRRAVGTILNSVVDDLINRVVKLEDIAADAAIKIYTLYVEVKERAPKVFLVEEAEDDVSENDVVRYVRRWSKFQELIVVLNASLREIENRWACGKGPLAAEFGVDEMKQLIRALFQNTDRRAAVLARIKYE